MVSQNSNRGAKNNGFPQSSPDALHLYKRFKKVNKQEVPNQDRDEEKRKPASSRRLKNTSDNFNSSSGSSPEIFKRTIESEKLFRLQCQSQYKKPTQDSSFSTDSSSSSGSDRKRRYLTSGDNNTNSKHCVNMTGVLHLRQPLSTNLANEKMYYEDRGRMPPIDWNNVTSSRTSPGPKPEKVEKAETKKEKIKTIAKSKPQISDEFSNFVENSISYNIAYGKQGNIERTINTIDSPIFRIQQRISRKTLDTIQVPASVKLSFFKTSSDSHLLNNIDTFRAIDPMTAGIETNNHTVDSAVVQVESKYQDSKVEKDKTQDCRPTHTCDDYDRITFIDTLTDEESAAKRESRKKEMEYNDELFTFVQNPPESLSSQINASLPAPSVKKRNSYRFPFARIKAVCREKKAMISLDSDDTLYVSSDLENSSNRMVSMHTSFEAVKRKMSKLTSLGNNPTNDDKHILPDDEILENKNKLLNRCIRASHDYLKAPENNVVEITEVKVCSRQEPLIKPISTRYFAKDSTGTEECNDMNIMNNGTIKSLSQEEQGGNGIINNSFPSTVSIESESHQKDNKIDSGFCIKSTDNSSSIHSSSETISESEIRVEKNACAPEVTEKFGSKSEMLKMSSDSESEEMDCEDFIDYDAFDVENVEMFFPGLNVQNLKKQAISKIIGENHETLASDFEISNNNYSNYNASFSSNLYSDSQNPPSSNSQFSFNSNIFENVDIKISALTTDGLDYSNNQTQKHKNAHLALYPTNEIENVANQSSDQENAGKTDSEENFINNNTSLCNIEKSELSNENVVVTPKPVSKKMQKYRSTLENCKKKFKPEAESKEKDKNLEQLDNASQITTFDQNPLQRPILKEIQKRIHKLTFKKFSQ